MKVIRVMRLIFDNPSSDFNGQKHGELNASFNAIQIDKNSNTTDVKKIKFVDYNDQHKGAEGLKYFFGSEIFKDEFQWFGFNYGLHKTTSIDATRLAIAVFNSIDKNFSTYLNSSIDNVTNRFIALALAAKCSEIWFQSNTTIERYPVALASDAINKRVAEYTALFNSHSNQAA